MCQTRFLLLIPILSKRYLRFTMRWTKCELLCLTIVQTILILLFLLSQFLMDIPFSCNSGMSDAYPPLRSNLYCDPFPIPRSHAPPFVPRPHYICSLAALPPIFQDSRKCDISHQRRPFCESAVLQMGSAPGEEVGSIIILAWSDWSSPSMDVRGPCNGTFNATPL
jgi:hypothetical protein